MRVLFLFGLSVGFYIHQNEYFGWNRKPQSEAELIADGIVFLLLAIAVAASLKGKARG